MRGNKRKHARASVLMHSTLFQGERPLGRFRVQNLSVGGALLEGQPPVARGGSLEILIELSPDVLVRARATVVRVTRHPQPSFALMFTQVANDCDAALAVSVAENLAAAWTAQGLIACDDESIGVELRASLRGLGLPCVLVARPLEVIHCLEVGSRFRCAIVDSAFGADGTGELFRHLADAHPSIRRLLLLDHTAERPRTDLAQAVLERPWTPDTLRRALDL
jgi:hypothetical protein